ncbi:response regulator [Pseudomonas nicosulfuronedens]|uniref:Response regulator n=1 Tax=Pseudomonas nicosulfuronedens TaxID=2571105 RepID=A0A5R9QM95_9PSED|nr:response regulator [Pseudomonas nicosulfuronedens]MDH1012976.1 response regulator [Pseudomonas nicosulfuronedens]MDH1983122.1 response regulator [Pseudomonas nicosulfuronedens]MDH2030772.1 response regulator [Pseudomonas nicosulfuronedens]TLX70696.1 response regulator [Pseudomonas nicosulfuronedens]
MSRIVVADPQPFVREALRQRLTQAGHEVVGETGDGREALALVQRLHPDLLLLDLDLPRLGGLELLQRLRSGKTRQKALVFTQRSGAHYHELSQQAGASGYVHKGDQPAELDDAVKLVLSGRKVFPARQSSASAADLAPGEVITPRELTVLQYLAQGYRIKDIADELAISDRTVSTYKTRLLEKTHTDSLIDLIATAQVRGLLSDQQVLQLAQRPLHGMSKVEGIEQLLGLLPNAASLWSIDGVLLTCNQSYAEQHGRSKAALIGLSISQVAIVDPKQLARYQREFLEGAALGVPFSLVVSGEIEGEARTYRLIGVPIREDSGSMLGVLCYYVNVTESEQLVERLQEARIYLESLFVSRAAFLLSSGRDLLQELKAVANLVGALRMDHANDPKLGEVPQHLEKMRDKLEVLMELIELDRGTPLMMPRPEELNRLTQDALQASEPQQPFEPDTEALWAWIDRGRYQRLLVVLLRALHKAGLQDLKVSAHGTSLPGAEVEWRLTIRSNHGTPLQLPLTGMADQARIHLAHRLCRLLHGELLLDGDAESDIAALIQLKLPKGNARF